MSAPLRLFMLVLLFSGLTACSTLRPVDTPSIGLPAHYAFSDEHVQQAILKSLATYHWHVEQTQPGRIQASILVRERHQAAIAIEYDERTIVIRYLRSQGLEYKNGSIHRTYNRWVKYLKLDIEHQLNLSPTP